MLTPTRGIAPASSLEALISTSNKSPLTRTTPDNSSTSFAEQLAKSLESYLGQTPSGSHLQIDISPQQGPISGTRQFIVTVKDASDAPAIPGSSGTAVPVSTAVSATTASTSAPGTIIDVSGMLMFSGIPKPPPPESAVGPVDPPITNEVDAYWAAQPKEVQELRTIDDYVARGEKGQELAQKGFVIDSAIMLQRWDPYMTMKDRKEEGYTWVPALGQDGVPLAPGLSFPGMAKYDAKNPPPGSIQVSTDFAKGLEYTSIGARPAHPGDPAVS